MTTLRSTKSNDRSLLRHGCLLLSLALGFWLALEPAARAVSPPPDRSYPNFTTAEGANALFSLTTGSANTAVSFFSLFSNAAGNFNTAVGAGALDLNTATGVDALALNDTGRQNTATGAFAFFNKTIGIFNTATGDQRLMLNSTGAGNASTGAPGVGK